jgi:hypothetical protein
MCACSTSLASSARCMNERNMIRRVRAETRTGRRGRPEPLLPAGDGVHLELQAAGKRGGIRTRPRRKDRRKRPRRKRSLRSSQKNRTMTKPRRRPRRRGTQPRLAFSVPRKSPACCRSPCRRKSLGFPSTRPARHGAAHNLILVSVFTRHRWGGKKDRRG